MKKNIFFGWFSAFIFFGCVTAEREAWEKVESVEEQYESGNREVPELDGKSELGDLLAYALLKNAALEAEFNSWKSELEKIPQVRSLPDPKFEYGYFIREVETRVGPQKHKFGISQIFPWYGTLLLKGEAAFEKAESSRQSYEAEKLKLFYSVKDVYYDYYFLGRSLDIIKDNLALFREMEKIAGEKYQAGVFKYPDLIRIQIETSKFAERLDSLKDFNKPLMAKFAHVLNRDRQARESAFPYPDKLHLKSFPEEEKASLKELVMVNPKLKEFGHRISIEETKKKIARRGYIPDVTLGVDYIQTDRRSAATRPSDNGKDPLIAMVSVNLPIYFNKYEAERREAEARRKSFELKKTDLEKMLLSEFEKQIFKMKDAKRKILLYRDDLIPKAEKSLAVIKRSYIAGGNSYLDFVDAQQTLLKFELILEQNRVKYARAIAKIEKLTGKEILTEADF